MGHIPFSEWANINEQLAKHLSIWGISLSQGSGRAYLLALAHTGLAEVRYFACPFSKHDCPVVCPAIYRHQRENLQNLSSRWMALSALPTQFFHQNLLHISLTWSSILRLPFQQARLLNEHIIYKAQTKCNRDDLLLERGRIAETSKNALPVLLSSGLIFPAAWHSISMRFYPLFQDFAQTHEGLQSNFSGRERFEYLLCRY